VAQRKSILKKIQVETAERQRRCRYTRCRIAKGELCIVVFDGPQQRFCYSREIGLKMLMDASATLAELQTQLRYLSGE
jgi:hypothetical protein